MKLWRENGSAMPRSSARSDSGFENVQLPPRTVRVERVPSYQLEVHSKALPARSSAPSRLAPSGLLPTGAVVSSPQPAPDPIDSTITARLQLGGSSPQG